MDIVPAKPYAPKETYLDAYKRRMYKSYYVKPKVEPHDPRGYMETFDTHEATFRPVRRYINPDHGYQMPWRSGRGNGESNMEGRTVHVGNNGAIVTPSGEYWRRGRRYFLPTSGSWTEPPFKPSLRYIASTLSDHGQWRPCIRVYKVRQPHYFNPRQVRRRYIPQPYGFDDKYERLTPIEACSKTYSPRRIQDINAFKPEWIGFSNSGVPFLKPFRKGVTLYLRRHPTMQLFPPQPPIIRRPISKKVLGYSVKHPSLQLFSADFRPELTSAHPAYLSTTRYDPLGHYDHFEDHGLTLQPDVRLPEPLGAQHIPPHCPPYEEVRTLPNLAGDIIGVDVVESQPKKVMSPRLAEKNPGSPFKESPNMNQPSPPAPKAAKSSEQPQTTGQHKRPNTAKENVKPVSPSPPPGKRPQTVPTAHKETKQAAQKQQDVHSRFMTEYMRSFSAKYLPEKAKAALQPWMS